GSASAERAPNGTERAAIAAAFKGYVHEPGSPAAKDNRILSIDVSTLDRRYALVRLNSASAGPSELVLHESHSTWWVLEFGSSLGCNTAPRSVLADLRVGCTPPGSTAWIDACGPLVSAPKSLVLACADANYGLVRVHWRAWGTGTATATGAVSANDCTPSCAAGHFHTYPVTVTADHLRGCGRARTYERLTIAYAGPRPKGVTKRDVHTLGC
ncbi:MAG: hypothetical protein ACRDLR_04775, partial [Gaiellaceae bacterium]